MNAPDRARQGDPDLRVPRAPARRAAPRAARPRRHPRGVRAARLRAARDPRRRAGRPAARQGRRRRQGDLRRQPPRRRRAAARRCRARACTSTSPCRSRATCSRTPASSPSRSAATRSRRCGAASDRRRAASASSPRPTSTSSTSASSPRTSRPRCRSSSPRCSAACRWGSSASRSTTARSPRASTAGIGLTDVVGTLRIVDKLDKIGPDKVTAMLARGRRDAGAGAPGAWRWPSIRSTDLSFVEPVRALGRAAPDRSTRVSTPSPPSSRSAWSRRPACSSPTCRSPAASTTTPAPSTRPSSSGPSRGARSARAGATTRWPPTAARPTPASASRSALTRLVAPARRQARAHGEPLDAGGRARRRRRRGEPRRRPAGSPTALRARGIPCEVAPSAAKFGKQIRYADRRGIPFVWFPGGGGGRRRPGQGHPLRRAGRRRCRDVAVPAGGPAPGRRHAVQRSRPTLPDAVAAYVRGRTLARRPLEWSGVRRAGRRGAGRTP